VGEYLNLRSKQNEEAGPLLAEDSDADLGVDAGKRSSVRKDVAKPKREAHTFRRCGPLFVFLGNLSLEIMS